MSFWSRIAALLHDLHILIFYVSIGASAIVFVVLLYSLIHFRKCKSAVSTNFHKYLGIEILWTILPFIILVVLVIPATIVLMKIHHS